MKRINVITLIAALVVVLVAFGVGQYRAQEEVASLKVGFIYVGDEATSYTKNFKSAQKEIEELYGDQVSCSAKYNINEGYEATYIQELLDEGCQMIFGTSYGYASTMKEYAQNNPGVVFCQAAGSNANDDPVLSNYHTYMGHIYEGRYIAGIVGGMKMSEMIRDGLISEDQAVIGYVAAYPYAEVISGYTAFLLGARTACPSATMKVKYSGTWNGYVIEKKLAEELIDEGCVLISQHSDTSGPAVACEASRKSYPVYHVSYNQNMKSIAPTSSLIGCKVDWGVYEKAAVGAMLKGESIEGSLSGKASINGNDAGAGFDEGWVEMLELNDAIAPDGAAEAVKKYISLFKSGKVHVFMGNYVGVNPMDPSDTIDLSTEYHENQKSSAPSFCYVLNDVIKVEE